MAMIVRYNAPANRALVYGDKNSKARSKNLANLASGMKINSAADDAANLSISSRMRVKLRALDQDAQNVQNGAAILNTAEGGIQGQIDLLRTIREKVINAANDSNTDPDRQTIQKEIEQFYTQIENLAYDTDYNTKKPLIGDFIVETVEINTTGIGDEEILKSGLDLIPNNYEKLDDIDGPFDIFTEYSARATSNRMSGGADGKPKIMTFDFSSYTNVSQLNNIGFSVKGVSTGGGVYSPIRYVLTNNMNNNYLNVNQKVSVGNSVSAAIDNLVSAIKKQQGYYLKVEREGMKIKITTVNETSAANNASIDGANGRGGIITVSETKSDGKKAGVSGRTSGGVNDPLGDPDLPPAAKATLTADLSKSPSDSGFSFNYSNFRIIDPGETIQRNGVITLTKGQSSSGYTSYFQYNFDGSNITFTARADGTFYNNHSIIDGYSYTVPKDVNYTAYTDFAGAMETVQEASDTGIETASWTLNLSGMTVDDFSKKYSGQRLSFNGLNYKFYDSSLAPKVKGLPEDGGSRKNIYMTQIDIDDIRQSVSAGKTLAEALQENLNQRYTEVDGDKIKFISSAKGALGNSYAVTFTDETLRHYDINFSSLNSTKFPDLLYGKGFRAYCATDNKEWFNFILTDGTDSYDTDKDNIKSITIDVSAVTSLSELVTAIYEQAEPILTGSDPKFNHHMRIAADPDRGIITLYDHRRYNVRTSEYDYQDMGAKIADGFALRDADGDEEDNKRWKNFYVKDLVIQHTDKANMNIHIKIPQMTLDHIFHPLPAPAETIFDLPVTSKENRDALLGKPTPPGVLDKGLKYLLDAVTLVGAQNRRLEFTAENIMTEFENLTASESVIRDADMAKEVTDYVKNNVLLESSQAMLAQANQSHSSVLNLLG